MFLRGINVHTLDVSNAGHPDHLAAPWFHQLKQWVPKRLEYCALVNTTPTYGTKIIPVSDREAVHVLDEILGNSTSLPIAEHATDTHGQTLTVFSLFKLTGLVLSPRIRDLGGITLPGWVPATIWCAGSRMPASC